MGELDEESGTAAPREFWSPLTTTSPDQLTLPDLLRERLDAHPDGIFAEVKDADGKFAPITMATFGADVESLARGFIAAGVKAGDCVAIMGHTRYEWTVADFAVLSAGGVVAPIYETSSADQVRLIVEHTGAVLAVAETDEIAALFAPLVGTTSLGRVAVIDGGGLDELRTSGADVPPDAVQERSDACTPSTIATIVHTSGTTGTPKGVVLSHGNLVTHMVHGVDDPHFSVMIKGQDKRLLLFLPLAHVFARYIVVACLYAECVIGYEPDMHQITADLSRFHPTWMLAVPRVFETTYNQAELAAGGGLKDRIFRWAAGRAVAWSTSRDDGGPSPWLSLQYRVARTLVLDKVAEVLGGRVRYAISGSAPLSSRLIRFFEGLGILVMQGYGLTETAAPTTVELPGISKIGTVGPPYPGTGVRIEADGEVLIKGPNVFQGYLDDPKATAEVMTDDGWFRTGDLGRLDSDGYLTIVGRKKDMIVTAGGKNVQPEPLEDAIRTDPLVHEVVVVGDGRPFVAALISLDEETTSAWLANRGSRGLSPEQMRDDPDVHKQLQLAVDRANKQVSRAESVRAFRIAKRPFSEDKDEISLTEKARRTTIIDHFSDEIDRMYEDELAARDARRAQDR